MKAERKELHKDITQQYRKYITATVLIENALDALIDEDDLLLTRMLIELKENGVGYEFWLDALRPFNDERNNI